MSLILLFTPDNLTLPHYPRAPGEWAIGAIPNRPRRGMTRWAWAKVSVRTVVGQGPGRPSVLTAQHDELCTEAGMFVQSNANMAFHAGPVLPTTTTQKPLVMEFGQTSLERCDPSLADLVNMEGLPPSWTSAC